MHTLRLVVFASLALVVGCKKRVAPPTEQKVSAVGKDATFHTWNANASPCEGDPKILAGDLGSSAALLQEFLGQTSAGLEGVWTPEQIVLLDEANSKLGPLLDATENAVFWANKCKFEKADPITGTVKTATEVAALARTRLVEAPALAAKLKEKVAVKAWKDKQPEARAAAKTEWCPAKPKPGAVPDIYFAAEDETGHVEWLFCDDSKISAGPGSPPAFEAPATMKKKPKDKPYLERAAKYPASDIQHAPRSAEAAGAAPGAADGGTAGATDAGT